MNPALIIAACLALLILPKAIAQLLGPIDMPGVIFCVVGVIILLALIG